MYKNTKPDMIYKPQIGDKVKIINNKQYKEKTGTISLLKNPYTHNTQELGICDDVIYKQLETENLKKEKEFKDKFQKKNTSQAYDDFVSKIKQNDFDLYKSLKNQGKLKSSYERVLRFNILEEQSNNPAFTKKTQELLKNLIFFVPYDDIELIKI